MEIEVGSYKVETGASGKGAWITDNHLPGGHIYICDTRLNEMIKALQEIAKDTQS